MASIGQVFLRTVFWSYERGTWQYDLAVVLILVFALLTPRSWFHDQPEVGTAATPGEVQLLWSTPGTDRYQVDARVLAPPTQTPLLENELHNALQKSVTDLRHGRFSITKIDAVRNAQGAVTAYQVEIRR
jgi:hypothetical protein